jgi:hypothetical protein
MISLTQQIDEIERELTMRRDVYPRWVAQHKIRESVAAYQMARMEAVLKTLQWLHRNEDKIKATVGGEDAREV